MKLLPLILLLLPALAWADVKPTRTRINNRCSSYRMCDQQSSTGECVDVSNSDEIVLQVARFAHYTFYSTGSAAASYSCDIITNVTGFDASVIDSTATDQVNTASITDEIPVYTMAVLLNRLWITCSEISSLFVQIDVVVCPRD
jgi:hypothetical protein